MQQHPYIFDTSMEQGFTPLFYEPHEYVVTNSPHKLGDTTLLSSCIENQCPSLLQSDRTLITSRKRLPQNMSTASNTSQKSSKPKKLSDPPNACDEIFHLNHSSTASNDSSKHRYISRAASSAVEYTIRLPRPPGVVGMWLYSPLFLPFHNETTDYVEIFPSASFNERNIQPEPLEFSSKLNLVNVEIPQEKKHSPRSAYVSLKQSCSPLIRIGLPSCRFDRIKRELTVYWTENETLRAKKFSCKKLGKNTVLHQANTLMIGLAYIGSHYPFSGMTRMNAFKWVTEVTAQFSNQSFHKLPYLNEILTEIIYLYDGPFSPTLTYKKKQRVWIVTWTTTDHLQHTMRWSCKKLGKREAVMRAELFVNLISLGIPRPCRHPYSKFFKSLNIN